MPELVKNDIYDGEVTGFTSEADGVCRIAGRAVFVPRTLPGETWRVRILKANRTAVWGRGEALLSAPSPDRVSPACPVFGKCGGCACMHMTYEAELRFKLGRVNDALRRIGDLDLQAETILGAEHHEGYRNKAIYNLAPGPVCGFYRARSHDVISAGGCALQPEVFHRAANALLEWMRDEDIPAYDELTGLGDVRHLFLRRNGEDLQACVVSARALPESLVPALRTACPELAGILFCWNDRPGNTVLTPDIRTLWGRDTLEMELCGTRFSLSPQTFFQINTDQAERLYTLVRQYAEPAGKTVLDLYCGAGSIGLSVAKDASRLLGNDVVPSAVENARENARRNGILNAAYFCGDAAAVAHKLAEDGLRPEVIITDPPRKGMDENVLTSIDQMGPERVVYVSCDPGTLARDLKRLHGLNYTAERCVAVDMFPRTQHVETVTLLSRRKDEPRIQVTMQP